MQPLRKTTLIKWREAKLLDKVPPRNHLRHILYFTKISKRKLNLKTLISPPPKSRNWQMSSGKSLKMSKKKYKKHHFLA